MRDNWEDNAPRWLGQPPKPDPPLCSICGAVALYKYSPEEGRCAEHRSEASPEWLLRNQRLEARTALRSEDLAARSEDLHNRYSHRRRVKRR